MEKAKIIVNSFLPHLQPEKALFLSVLNFLNHGHTKSGFEQTIHLR
jgi:hypothetical protein